MLAPSRAELFGSMSTGFGTKGCDLDVVILSQDSPETEAAAEILMKLRRRSNYITHAMR